MGVFQYFMSQDEHKRKTESEFFCVSFVKKVMQTIIVKCQALFLRSFLNLEFVKSKADLKISCFEI